MKRKTLLLSCLVAGVFSANAQVALTGVNPTYSQDFNTLTTSGTTNAMNLTGWAIYETGSNANQQYRNGDGSANTGDTYSFGTGTAADRALGTVLSGNLKPSFGVSFANNTGLDIISVNIAYRGEQWRRGNTTSQVDSLHFAYSTNATSLSDGSATWTRVSTLDVVSVSTNNTAAAVDGNVSFANKSSVVNLSVPAGATVWFRWVDYDISGTDDGLAIDDLQINFTTQANTDTIVKFAPTSATVNETDGSTNLTLTYATVSPSTGFSVDVVLKSGNASDIDNYTTQNVTFVPGNGTATLPITITDNATNDGNQTLIFALRNPSADFIIGADSLFTLTIIDDEAPVDTVVNFASTSASVAENAGNASLPLSYAPLSATTSFTVDVVLKSGNAAELGNYTTQTASFAGGTATSSIPVSITDDALVNGNRTFVFVLRNPSSDFVIGNDSTFTLTVTDDDTPVHNPYPYYTIAHVRGNNTSGQADSLGVKCELRGVVYGVNLRTGGLEFTINDGTAGIGVYAPASSNTFGYNVTEGDSIHVRGEIMVYRGLSQIAFLDTLYVAGTGTVPQAILASDLGEDTESELIAFTGFKLVNVAQWTNSGSFNVDITNGTKTFQLRVHANTTLFGTPAPTGTFSVVGIGGQFATTSTAPYNNGYQIIPRKLEDIIIGNSIAENEASANMQIFPNPSQGRFMVSFESTSASKANVELKDLTGRTITAKTVTLINGKNQFEIDENLSAGIYLVSIQIGKERAVKRVIVQ